jgi:hypothetical protein
MDHMRAAFCLNLAEVKPLAALSRTNERDLLDEIHLERVLMPAILYHRGEWDTQDADVVR